MRKSIFAGLFRPQQLVRYAAFAAVFAVCGVPSTVNAASVSGATEVLITSNIPDYLQIAEVIATEIGTGTNVALSANGGSASAFSEINSFTSPARAIDGVYPADYPNNIYFSAGNSSSEYLDVLLGHASNLASLTIYGRDGCCKDRDFFQVVIFNALHQQLYSGLFDVRDVGSVTVNFDAAAVVPVPAALPLFASGLAGLGWLARRRKKQAAA